MYDCRVRCERSGYCYGYLIKSDFHFFFVVFKGLTVWPRRCAQKAILDATEVFFAFLSTVINNTVTVKEISPPTPACSKSFYHYSDYLLPQLESHKLFFSFVLFLYLKHCC